MSHEQLTPEGAEQYIQCATGYLLNPEPSRCARCTMRRVVAREVTEIAFANDLDLDDIESRYTAIMAECPGGKTDKSTCVGADGSDHSRKKIRSVCGHPDSYPGVVTVKILELMNKLLSVEETPQDRSNVGSAPYLTLIVDND